MKKHATISDCGKYRYWLERRWEEHKDYLNFIMLNPSTADAEVDDPTIRKCIGFAKKWGYGGIHVTNLFAFRATDPSELERCECPIGPNNGSYLEAGILSAPVTICAWGANKMAAKLAPKIAGLLKNGRAMALRRNKDGSPAHPLYVPYSVTPVDFNTLAVLGSKALDSARG